MTFTPLSDDELGWMRRDATASLMDACTITRTSGGVVNPDGSKEPGTPVVFTFACRVGPLGTGANAVEQVYAARLEDVTGFLVLFPWDAVILETDIIQYGTQFLQVLGVLGPQSNLLILETVCKRIS
jgi:hypothetical protein